jgi:hypothetical protein
MGDWLLNLPIPWMALVIFAAIYFVAAVIYLIVIRLAKDDRARAFKAISPGMLPPLGIIFGLLVGFIAVGVWNDFDRWPRSQSAVRPAPFAASSSSLKAFPMSSSHVFVLSSIVTSRKR